MTLFQRLTPASASPASESTALHGKEGFRPGGVSVTCWCIEEGGRRMNEQRESQLESRLARLETSNFWMGTIALAVGVFIAVIALWVLGSVIF